VWAPFLLSALRQLQVPPALGDLWQDGHGRYRVNRSSGADCLFREKWEMTPGYGHRLAALTVTKAGVERLTRYYQQGKLPMKKELA
jgi:hypothetical protein